MADPTGYQIGSTLGGLASLASQNIIDPQSQFFDQSKIVVLGSGLTKTLGYPRASWHWDYLTELQWDALLDYTSGANSAYVYFSTMLNSGLYKAYYGIMKLPETYSIRVKDKDTTAFVGRYIDVTIEFSMMVVQTIPE